MTPAMGKIVKRGCDGVVFWLHVRLVVPRGVIHQVPGDRPPLSRKGGGRSGGGFVNVRAQT